MKLILFDINEELCYEWKREFSHYPDVEIKNCNLLDLECDYVVTAGNSFGWMTGGIDLAVRNYFGMKLQDLIQQHIVYNFNGFLPVGKSLILTTSDFNIRGIIYAPTMALPEKISSLDAFYVFASILENTNTKEFENKIIACCGLGSCTGGLSPSETARAMRMAYEYVYHKEGEQHE